LDDGETDVPDLDRNPAVIGHGDSGISIDRTSTWFREGVANVLDLLHVHHDSPSEAAWDEILPPDSPLRPVGEAISSCDSLRADGLELFQRLGIEVSSESWGGEMPGHGGFYLVAWADGQLRLSLRRQFKQLAQAIEEWNRRRSLMEKADQDHAAVLAELREELTQAEQMAREAARTVDRLRDRLREVEQQESMDLWRSAEARLDQEAKRLIALAKKPEGRFHREGFLLIDPDGLIWRLHGTANEFHGRHHTEDLVAAIRRRRRRVVDVVEWFEAGDTPPRMMQRAHRTWEGWTQDVSRLRLEHEERADVPDPEVTRQRYLDWCRETGEALPPGPPHPRRSARV
jgi:hypothetical protein